MWRRRCFHGINAMILMPQIFDATANENTPYKRNELEWSFLVHLSRRLKCTIGIMRCSSSVRPSSVVVNFSHFRLLLWNHERNLMKLYRKVDLNVLYQVCVFRADQKNKMAALASDWLRHFRLLLCNDWTEFKETWQEARSQCPLPSLCFSGRSEKQDGRPGLWLAETFSTSFLKPLNAIQRILTGSKISTSSTNFLYQHDQVLCFSGRSEKQDGCPGLWLAETFSTSPLKPLNGIQRNLTGSKISTSSTKFVFFGPIGKTRWPRWPLMGWDIFDFSSETAEWNSMKLDRKQDINVLYQVCVFRAERKNKMAALASDWLRHFRLLLWYRWMNSTKLDRKQDLNVLYQVCVFRADQKNKMAALASDWLRHFRLLLWNRWTELNETWQEARSQCPVPSLCFLGGSEKQDGRLANLSKRWHIVLRCTICGPLGLLFAIWRKLVLTKIKYASIVCMYCIPG